MANRTWQNFGHFYAPHTMPILLDCNFVIDVANGNGLGVRSVKGPGIAQVFGHTTASAATFNTVTNNMPAGYFQIFLQDNYNKYFGGFDGFVTPVSGTPILVTAGLSVGTVYVIVSPGTTTLAGWQALGLPLGIAPVAGATFSAITAVAGSGTGAVEVAAVNGAGVAYVEAVGDPNTTIAPVGLHICNPYIIVRTMAATSAGVTTPIATQPADGSVMGLAFYMSNSSVQVQGE